MPSAVSRATTGRLCLKATWGPPLLSTACMGQVEGLKRRPLTAFEAAAAVKPDFATLQLLGGNAGTNLIDVVMGSSLSR